VVNQILRYAGAELIRDADGVARMVRRQNRRGGALQRALQVQAAAGHQVVRRMA